MGLGIMEPIMMSPRVVVVLALVLVMLPLAAAGSAEQVESDALMAWKERLEGFKADGSLSTWESSSSPCTDWEGVSCQGGSLITDMCEPKPSSDTSSLNERIDFLHTMDAA